jgi:hypothetical protein
VKSRTRAALKNTSNKNAEHERQVSNTGDNKKKRKERKKKKTRPSRAAMPNTSGKIKE